MSENERLFWIEVRRHLLRVASDPAMSRRSLLGIVAALERYHGIDARLPDQHDDDVSLQALLLRETAIA